MSEPVVVSDAERSRRLDDAVGQFLMAGYQMRGRSGFEAAVGTPGRDVNHVLHLLISVFTCGLWVVMWFLLTVTAPQAKVIYVMVDEWGRAWSRRADKGWEPL